MVLQMENDKKFEIEVLTRLTKIETMLEDFKGIKTKLDEAYNLSTNNKKRIDELEDNNKWFFRTSIGAIIVALIGLIISFIK